MKSATVIFPGSKMSELLLTYPHMITVLERMNIALGFGDQKIQEIAKRYHIEIHAFLAILQAFEGSIKRDTTLGKESIPDVLSFLKSSHRYFRGKQIPYIKELIALFSKNISPKHGQVIISFFDEYIREVEEHFHYEDDDIFPYIENRLKDVHSTQFRIREFEKNHTDIEQKLLDLKNILIKYIPEEITSDFRIKILKELFVLEQDLIYHSFIEDHLLVPSIKQLEQNIQNQIPDV